MLDRGCELRRDGEKSVERKSESDGGMGVGDSVMKTERDSLSTRVATLRLFQSAVAISSRHQIEYAFSFCCVSTQSVRYTKSFLLPLSFHLLSLSLSLCFLLSNSLSSSFLRDIPHIYDRTIVFLCANRSCVLGWPHKNTGEEKR